jgi:hypothetical protein
MALTDAQLTALRLGHATGKLCLEIDCASPLRYCTGQNAVEIDSDWYYPRWMKGRNIDLTNPGNSKTSVRIDDRDRVLETRNYTDRFSGYDATVHILLKEDGAASWTTASSFVWGIERAVSDGVSFQLFLYAAAGTKKKFGLTKGNLSIFPWAPEPGTSFKFGSGSTSTTGGGSENPYALLYGTTSSIYWPFIDPYGQMAAEAGLAQPYWVNDEVWADTLAGLEG